MKIAICNTKVKECSDLECFINKCSVLENEKIYIDRFSIGDDLLSNIKSGEFYDLVFIYCSCGYDNGSVIGDIIRNELDNQNISIVYISDHKIETSKLIDSRPIKLLIEPITENDIIDIFAVLSKIRGNTTNCFKLKNGNDIKFIPYKDILYFASVARKILVITNKGKYSCYGKIMELKDITGFIKVHKSFLINLNYIKEYNYKTLKMENNDEIPISQSLRPSVKNIIENL